MEETTINTRVSGFTALVTPCELRREISVTPKVATQIKSWRQEIAAILSGDDTRTLVIVGPCSVHDVGATMSYAEKLAALRKSLPNLFVVMRVYLQKPRTTTGWTGLLDDPTLDGKYDSNSGIRLSRKLLRDIATLGVPAATEFLGTTVEPQYIADLISWGCIGARTVESQIHRHLVSGLSMPVGFKNASDGSYEAAVCACVCASTPRSFIGIDDLGNPCIVHTTGNSDLSVVLRGSYTSGPNDHLAAKAGGLLAERGFPCAVIIDAAHGNSGKTTKGQIAAIERVKLSIRAGYTRGIMIESFLEEGGTDNVEEAKGRGISITDPCIGWERTFGILESLNNIRK